MDRLGAGRQRGFDDSLCLQVAFRHRCGADADRFVGERDMGGAGLDLGVDGDDADAQAARGACDAAGDFAPVGDQEAIEHLEPHIRKTPNLVSGTGALRETEMPSPRTSRVSRGSISPSSQIRAVA